MTIKIFKNVETKQYEAQIIYKNIIESILHWPSTAGIEAYPSGWFIYPVRLQ